VGNDISTDRLLRIRVEHRTWSAVNLRNNLIRDDDGNPELISQALQSTHELGKVRLTGRQLTTAVEVRSVQ
jgi:hypothetical protein